jgi:ankyrin repeat protein
MNKIKIYLLSAAVLIAIAGVFYLYLRGADTRNAIQQLDAQGLERSPNSFIAEIKAGHKDNVHYLILAGATADLKDDNGVSALQAAAAGTDDDITDMVLGALPAEPQKAADIINQKNPDGKTPLILAVERNDTALVSKLLSLNAEVTITNNAQETPLLIAIKHNFDDLVQPLIDADTKEHHSVDTLLASDTTGKTPMIYAVEQQKEKLVKVMLDNKVSGTAPDAGGTTPLMIAAEIGNIPIAKLFLNAGAKIEVSDTVGNTPLTIAISRGHEDFVKFLIDSGADVDFHTKGPLPLQVAIDAQPFNFDMVSLLMTHSKQVASISAPLIFKAIDMKKPDVVKTLLDSGISLKTTDASGETLLYHAIESGDENLVLMLIDKGADIMLTGVPGITPIEAAASRNESNVVIRLLSMGISPNQKTSEGYSIAEIAVYRGYPETLKALLAKNVALQKDFSILWSIRDGAGKAVPVLLAYGANPNTVDGNGNSALWLAASINEVDAIQALVQKHADINYLNKQQMTPLAIAAHMGQLAAVQALVEDGAKLELKDNYGMTALAHAAYMSNPDIVEYLISKGADRHTTDNQGRSVVELAGLAAASQGRDRILMLLQKQ